jgi:hypothetical protein
VNDRDEFAKAALAGLTANAVYNSNTARQIATEAYELADAMLGERANTTHDGSPEPKAHLPTTDHAGGRNRESDAGTGKTLQPIGWITVCPDGIPGRQIVCDEVIAQVESRLVGGTAAPVYIQPVPALMGHQAWALNRAADCLERAAKRAKMGRSAELFKQWAGTVRALAEHHGCEDAR